ncbi:MAG: ferrous iron transport protein A [Burkholderiales bacterium]|nr:MAG: ferrous iron transport protein A [Burkholderiales bacterium]
MLKSTLADLALQAAAVVESLDMDFALRERLFALGLRVGRTIRVVRRFGRHGPLQVRVDHTDVILRGAEARRIRVVPIGGEAQA